MEGVEEPARWDLGDPSRLRVNRAGLTRCAPTWAWDSGRSPWWDQDLWVVLDGRGELVTPRGRYPLARGDCFVLRGGERYRGRQDLNAPLLVSHTHFDVVGGDGAPRRPAPELPGLHRRIDDPAFFEGVLRRLWEATLHQGDGDAARHWLATALRCVRDADRTGSDRAGGERRRLDAIRRRLLEDPRRTWSIAALAAEFGCGPDHFARRFRHHFGLAPRDFALRARMEHAAFRLATEDTPINAIAADLGYDDPRFFSRQFRRHHGLPPGRWRRARP